MTLLVKNGSVALCLLIELSVLAMLSPLVELSMIIE